MLTIFPFPKDFPKLRSEADGKHAFDPVSLTAQRSAAKSHYIIASSNGRGGKAGKGHNKTATIQVQEQIQDGYLVKAQFRYTVGSSESMANAIRKALAWDRRNSHMAPPKSLRI